MCRKKIYHILHILIIIGLVLFFGSVAFYLYINWTSKPYPIENETVRAYLKHTDDKTIAVYVDGEYQKNDFPDPIIVKSPIDGLLEISSSYAFEDCIKYACTEGSNCIFNLTPDTRYYYRVKSDENGEIVKKGSFAVSDSIRMLYIDGIFNVRDIGGWDTSNGQIDWGMIYRGSELDGDHGIAITEQGMQAFIDAGIKGEVDLRSDAEMNNATYPVREYIDYSRLPVMAYVEGILDFESYGKVYRYIFDCVLNDKPVYIHCWGGCDRTGTVIALLEGILGVSKEDIVKDYELSSFSIFGIREYGEGTEGVAFKEMIDYIEKNYEGDSFQHKCMNYFYDLGFTEDEIKHFCSKMIEQN
ncbi:tyrosine-protein phosphatase [uncultured Acetatifactor sp.]|uniref:tyrosine-protein phosphatase n=1 Tax=uncultured Acetatifactor sp. TaxID=1671927 RepID=UPI002617838F|nr:tyrosine-protein phosphatase [uncultured Acetatifactor sp.]